jgi:hypothetical protein
MVFDTRHFIMNLLIQKCGDIFKNNVQQDAEI